VALPYSAKVSGLLAGLQVEMPPINLVNAGRLLAYIDRSWDRRTNLQEKSKAHLPRLKREARKTNRLAVSLLKNPPVRDEKPAVAPPDTSGTP
jgi:hypothetical protein